MASLTEARAAIDDAFRLVAGFGVTVLTARPKESKSGWVVEIETARPLPSKIAKGLEVAGVPVVVWDHGLPAPRFAGSTRRSEKILTP